jgi:hypothetical protein
VTISVDVGDTATIFGFYPILSIFSNAMQLLPSQYTISCISTSGFHYFHRVEKWKGVLFQCVQVTRPQFSDLAILLMFANAIQLLLLHFYFLFPLSRGEKHRKSALFQLVYATANVARYPSSQLVHLHPTESKCFMTNYLYYTLLSFWQMAYHHDIEIELPNSITICYHIDS